MTLVNALESLKAKGITRLVGMYGETDINAYIDHARGSDEKAELYAEQGWAKYHKEHADGHYIVETNGHYIITTQYDNFDMATYGTHETEEDMRADFEAWETSKQAEEIADEMTAKRPGELPREAWVLIAKSELENARKAAKIAFERDFPA